MQCIVNHNGKVIGPFRSEEVAEDYVKFTLGGRGVILALDVPQSMDEVRLVAVDDRFGESFENVRKELGIQCYETFWSIDKGMVLNELGVDIPKVRA